MIRAGDLDRTIVIERRSEAISASGAIVATYAPVATLRAKLVTITTANILRNAGGLVDRATVFQTRWLGGLQADDRVSFEGTTLTLKNVREIGRRVGLELTCEASL